MRSRIWDSNSGKNLQDIRAPIQSKIIVLLAWTSLFTQNLLSPGFVFCLFTSNGFPLQLPLNQAAVPWLLSGTFPIRASPRELGLPALTTIYHISHEPTK